MSESALTPDLALQHLRELSSDVRAAVLLDARGRVAATDGESTDATRLGELAAELLERASHTADPAPAQIEVSVPGGTVYAVSHPDWKVVVLAGRGALSSLMFYDLRSVLSLLEQKRAA